MCVPADHDDRNRHSVAFCRHHNTSNKWEDYFLLRLVSLQQQDDKRKDWPALPPGGHKSSLTAPNISHCIHISLWLAALVIHLTWSVANYRCISAFGLTGMITKSLFCGILFCHSVLVINIHCCGDFPVKQMSWVTQCVSLPWCCERLGLTLRRAGQWTECLPLLDWSVEREMPHINVPSLTFKNTSFDFSSYDLTPVQ